MRKCHNLKTFQLESWYRSKAKANKNFVNGIGRRQISNLTTKPQSSLFFLGKRLSFEISVYATAAFYCCKLLLRMKKRFCLELTGLFS